MPTAQAPCPAEPAAPKMARCQAGAGKDEGPGADPVKTGCRDTARGHRRATARVPALLREERGRDPRRSERCAMRHSRVIPTTVSRSHDAAACSAHRLPNRGGSSVGQSSGLIIRRSQVQVLPAPPIYPRFRRQNAGRVVLRSVAPPPCREVARMGRLITPRGRGHGRSKASRLSFERGGPPVSGNKASCKRFLLRRTHGSKLCSWHRPFQQGYRA